MKLSALWAVVLSLPLLLPAAAGARAASPPDRGLILVSARTGAVDRSFPDVACCVLAVTSDGHGGWFVAGEFGRVGTSAADGIAHLRADGTLDRRWTGRLPGPRGLALDRVGTALYVAGPSWVERLDALTGARRWLTRVKGAQSPRIAANRGAVFVADASLRIGGVTRRSPVALDAASGRLLLWRAQLPPKYPDAYALALGGRRLFVGLSSSNGYFETVRALNVGTGRSTSWRAPQIKEVGSLFVTHGLLFVVGHDSRYVASERTGRPVRALAGVEGAVYAVAGDTLYVGGDCRGGSSFDGKKRDNLGAVDLRTNAVTAWAPHVGTKNVCVQALAADRDRVLVAGDFRNSLG